MLIDSHYLKRTFRLPEKEHRYGPNVHLVDDPYLFATLSKLGRPDTKQPLINQLLNTLYREMVKYVVNCEFPLIETTIETRMGALHPEGYFRGLMVDPATQVVCVNLARAGTVPSQICFDSFNYILNPDGVRQDHISINRKTNDNNEVVGTNLGGVKIGGDVKGRFVIVPDPMGATGSTLQSAMEIYRARGPAERYIALHLIVTPEYLKLAAKEFPELKIFAIRLDRGLSSAEVLSTVPGTQWDKEKGLNANQYIVPGAGGIGEVINNAYV
jgi:uracil phosphoribosyltransferase